MAENLRVYEGNLDDLTKRRKPEDVNYRQGDKGAGYCATCSHYNVKEDSCTKVDGEIGAANLCDLYDKWAPARRWTLT